MKITFFILAILLQCLFTSYKYASNNNDLENKKYLNFLYAVQNSSTYSYFTVVKVKNLNTGQVKEICTKGNFVAGAIHIELNLSYDSYGINRVFEFAKSKKDRYFEFKNPKALENVSFFTYNIDLISKIEAEYNFDKVIHIIKEEKEFSISFGKERNKAFAHALFNRGYLAGENNCYGGIINYVELRSSDNSFLDKYNYNQKEFEKTTDTAKVKNATKSIEKMCTEVLEINQSDSVFIFNSSNKKDEYAETFLTYLGTAKTHDGRSFKIINYKFIWGPNRRTAGSIYIFNEKNQYIGIYGLGDARDLPTRLRDDSLLFTNDNNNDCDKNLKTIVSLRKGLPQKIFIKCNEPYGDLYYFSGD